MPTVEFVLFDMVFEWDSDKERLVTSQHKITMQEAGSVFADVNAVTLVDERFEDSEQRYVIIGMSNQARLLVVAWTPRGENIRLITAVKAGKRYANVYERRR